MSERGHGYPDGFRLSLILEFERFGIAIRLLFAYPFGHPESEQNSSLNCCAPVDVLRSRWFANPASRNEYFGVISIEFAPNATSL